MIIHLFMYLHFTRCLGNYFYVFFTYLSISQLHIQRAAQPQGRLPDTFRCHTLKHETKRLGSPTAQGRPPTPLSGYYSFIFPRRATARAGKPTPPQRQWMCSLLVPHGELVADLLDVAAVAFQNEDPCFLGGAVREMVVLHGHLLDNVASVQFFTPVVQRPMPTLSVPVLRALVQLGPCIVHYFENFLEETSTDERADRPVVSFHHNIKRPTVFSDDSPSSCGRVAVW